jgi:hypothetical protein
MKTLLIIGLLSLAQAEDNTKTILKQFFASLDSSNTVKTDSLKTILITSSGAINR